MATLWHLHVQVNHLLVRFPLRPRAPIPNIPGNSTVSTDSIHDRFNRPQRIRPNIFQQIIIKNEESVQGKISFRRKKIRLQKIQQHLALAVKLSTLCPLSTWNIAAKRPESALCFTPGANICVTLLVATSMVNHSKVVVLEHITKHPMHCSNSDI